jgi:EVE domain
VLEYSQENDVNQHIASVLKPNAQGPRAWVGVVSLSHVQRGVEGGFAQVCHGKQAPLMRMQAGDWFVYYSPSTERSGGQKLRAFTAIGRVRERAAYLFDMGGGFVPYRRDIAYCKARRADFETLSTQLEFSQPGSNWGMLARRGHFEISRRDLETIARAMGVSVER